MFINNMPVESYGGVLIGTPRVSPVSVTPENTIFRNGTNFINQRTAIGLKTIECSIAFLGTDSHEIQLKRSKLRAALLGKINIAFKNDQFQYFCTYSTSNDVESEHNSIAVSTFTFTGVQHEDMETTEGNVVYCKSTVPETDCIIKGTVSGYYFDFNVAGVVFAGVADGRDVIVDGIHKRTIYEDYDSITSFIKFPVLKPGKNTLDIDTSKFSSLTIQYYPTYM